MYKITISEMTFSHGGWSCSKCGQDMMEIIIGVTHKNRVSGTLWRNVIFCPDGNGSNMRSPTTHTWFGLRGQVADIHSKCKWFDPHKWCVYVFLGFQCWGTKGYRFASPAIRARLQNKWIESSCICLMVCPQKWDVNQTTGLQEAPFSTGWTIPRSIPIILGGSSP